MGRWIGSIRWYCCNKYNSWLIIVTVCLVLIAVVAVGVGEVEGDDVGVGDSFAADPIFDGGFDFGGGGFVAADAGVDGEVGITVRIATVMRDGEICAAGGGILVW